jgi:hypothetical protein
MLMRIAIRAGLTEDFERSAISADGLRGGVADTGIPNFVYRWTEREVEKTIASYDPAHVTDIRFFYDLRLPIQRLARSGAGMMRAVTTLVEPLSKAFAKVLPSQCNEFAFAISKTGKRQLWIES